MTNRYSNSESMLERARKVIPMGSQTFSKSYWQYPFGVSPFFVERGQGAQVWDVDGNCYLDFVSSLHAVMLGHCDPDVDAAVAEQAKRGTLYSLASPIEVEVAEAIVQSVPSAEMVRFGKNGSDATSGAIRLARAITGREHVIVGGYHGWHDWYIGSTSRNLGVPETVCGLTHRFTFNDIGSLHTIFRRHPGQVAAVIMEVMNADKPLQGFLEEVAALTRKEGALLIFDEIITGFRFSRGGAQELFGVIPDLTTLGKGLANGYPLSAIVGRADVMRRMEDIFFSFTMGGETLSLAAARAVLSKIERQPVLQHMQAVGQRIIDGVQRLIEAHGIGHFLSISGHPVWSFLTFKEQPNVSLWDIKTLFLQETLARGFIIGAMTHNINFAHSLADADALLRAYEEVFPLLGQAVACADVRPLLNGCVPLQPIFKVR